jgi:hypothetical protein
MAKTMLLTKNQPSFFSILPPDQIINLVRPAKSVQAETDYRKGMATLVHGLSDPMCELSIGGQKFIFEPL